VQSVPEDGWPFATGGSTPQPHIDEQRWQDLLRQGLAMTDLSGQADADGDALPDLTAIGSEMLEHGGNERDLVKMLQDEDPRTVSLCEKLLWSMWFQAAGGQAAVTLHEAMDLSALGHTKKAFGLLDGLIERHPDFAEAYHQRGMAYSLCEDHYRALEDLHHTVQLKSIHFAAMANLGHACIELGRFEAARDWYLAALKVHPRLPGVRQMLRRLRELTQPRPHSSA